MIGTAAALAVAAGLSAQELPPGTMESFRWRSIGPANMGGRIVDIAGIPSPSHTFYVSAAGGGLFKTTNAGTTFQPMLDTIPVSSGGMIGIAPSDTNVVYYGTGEPNMRKLISPGAGVWKTADGGHTWKFVGLEKTQHIGRVVVDPHNANVAYVAAQGAAWSPSPDRGLYKTLDGGRSWKRVLYVTDSAGVIDVALDPTNPRVIWAASYEFLRTPTYVKSGGRGSALWRSADGGASWREIKGSGFPEGLKGRMGIALSSNGRVVYALIEGAILRNSPNDTLRERKSPITGLYRSGDGGAHWAKMNDRITRGFYFSQVRVDPRDANHVYWLDVQAFVSRDGGKTYRYAASTTHPDHHALWIDPADPKHLIDGNDGGFAQSWDGGVRWDLLNTLALGQFYNVSYNMAVPYRVCGGLQDNGTWCGPSRRRAGAITNSDWVQVNESDGGITAQSAADPDVIVAETQGGGISVKSFALGEDSRPTQLQLQRALARLTWSAVSDGEEPGGTQRIAGFHGVRALSGDSSKEDRRNWTTPFVLSAFDPGVLYVGAEHVVKITNLKNPADSDLVVISPDLTTGDTLKMRSNRVYRLRNDTLDHSEPETYCTISALAESPIRRGTLFAGTDDGNVWLTRDEGENWENLSHRFSGLPKNVRVTSIEPSHFDANVFYVAFNNHDRNDFRPYAYRTADGGKSFTAIVNGLTTHGRDHVWVVREHPGNSNVLFAGTDVGVFVSLDAGKRWRSFGSGLPTVSVRDLKIQLREGELIAATHGRSFWIADVAPLAQMDSAVATHTAYLFRPATLVQYQEPFLPGLMGYVNGNKTFARATPIHGMSLFFWGAEDGQRLRLTVQSEKGATVMKWMLNARRGLNRIDWSGDVSLANQRPLDAAKLADSTAKAHEIAALLDSAKRRGEIDTETLVIIADAVRSGDNIYGLAAWLRGVFRIVDEPLPTLPTDWIGEEDIPKQAAPIQEQWTKGLPTPVANLLERLKQLGAGSRAPWLSANPPAPGNYTLVLLTVSGEMRQPLRIERKAGR